MNDAVLSALVVGPWQVCRVVDYKMRQYYEVSQHFKEEAPEEYARLKEVDKCFVAPFDYKIRPDGMILCFEMVFNDKGEPRGVLDFGIGENVEKNGCSRYVLWNPETGELRMSKALDIAKVLGCEDGWMSAEQFFGPALIYSRMMEEKYGKEEQ